MQVNVVNGGDMAFRSLLYTHDENVMEYLQNKMENAYTKLQDTGSNMVEVARSMYESVNGSDAINRAKQVLYNIGRHVDPMSIYTLTEENIFDVNYGMQRYVMVEPTIFDLNQKQKCNAYDDTYIDVNPEETRLEYHDDYRSVMDGVLQFNDEGNGYVEEYLDAKELHFIDKVSILSSWDTVQNMLNMDIDPTSTDEDDRSL